MRNIFRRFMNEVSYPQRVCVYCGSSSQADRRFFDEAEKLGKLLAQNGIELIYGAGGIGVMGAIADSVKQNGGRVTGVIPRFMVEAGWHNEHVDKLIVTADMHERKSTMAKLSDAAVALPGGIGTLEELLEILTWKQLGLTTKPVVIVNINGYYDSLLLMLRQAIQEKFMRPVHADMWTVVTRAEEVLDALRHAPKWDKNQKKLAAI